MFINNTQRRIKDTQCEYTNTRTSNDALTVLKYGALLLMTQF